jgi:lipopolysaccharide biosynthesis protein
MELIPNIDSLNALLLVNDSVIGPFRSVKGILSKMSESYDFWGLTENYEHKYHLQSYFLHANQKVLASQNWANFWNGLILYENKLDIVSNYEIELTQTLQQNTEIKIGAWISQNELMIKYTADQFPNYPRTNYWHGIANPTVKNWKELLTNHEFPFIKKNLLLGKEHYHFSYEGEIFEYSVSPVNWKNTIAKKYGSRAVWMVQNYIDDYFDDKFKTESSRLSKYKILFISDSIQSSAQIDYVARLLQFYNRRNIETELIVNSVASLQSIFKRKLQDITRINTLSELSRKEQETLKHRLSQENIGTIIINDTSSAKLAQFFSFTGAPHILITHDSQPIPGISESVYNFKYHSPLIVSPLGDNCKDVTRACLDPVELPLKTARLDKHTFTKPSVISFIGLSNFRQQKDQIASIIQSLGEKGNLLSFKLLFNPDEYNELKKLLKDDTKLLSLFREDLNCTFIEYTNLSDYLEQAEEQIIISYFENDYMPNEYLHAFLAGRLLFMQKNTQLHASLFGKTDSFSFEFYKVEKLVDRISRLLERKGEYELVLREQHSALARYLENLQSNNYEQLLLKQVVDFSELREKEPIITVIFHFHFYAFDEVSFTNYKERLRAFFRSNVNFLFSITEDSYDIPRQVASLKNAFPNCTIKIVPNKGRDIGAKFILFDYFIKSAQPSEFIIVLHDKKSLHLPFVEAKSWVDSLLRIIDPLYYKTILKIFQDHENIGIIGSSERVVDSIIKWDEENGVKSPVFEWNNDLLNDMIRKYNIDIGDYNFVGGTMFWIRASLLRELDDKYKFIREYKALEEGNVMDNLGSTITHCWERLICWLSTNNGYKVGKV